MLLTRAKAIAVAAMVGMTFAPAAQALKFNLIDVGGAEEGTLARMGFDVATRYWSSVLTDNVTVNLEIGFDSLGGKILGQTGSNQTVILNSAAYQALRSDRTSALDMTAVTQLSKEMGANGAIGVRVNAYDDPTTKSGYTDTGTRFDKDGSGNNIALSVNTANLKAMGISQDAFGNSVNGMVDGEVVFNSDLPFDFDPTNGIDAKSSDFIAVAIHEIGHALGYVSGVDVYDLVSNPNSPIDENSGLSMTYAEELEAGLLEPGTNNLEGFAVGNMLDLFRYNQNGELDWSTSDGTKLFSVDGKTEVYGKGAFSLGQFNGDGNQASHWLQPADQSTRASACSNFLGIMNPYACAGYGDAVTGLDLAAMDAIGWDLNSSVRGDANYSFSTAQAFLTLGGFVPEPSTWLDFVLGFGLVGAVARGRRREIAAF